MYMLSCCLEGPGTPLSYCATDEVFMTPYRRRGDAKGCGIEEIALDFSDNPTSTEEKQLTTADTTTTVDDSTLFTEPCPMFKDFPGHAASQTAEEPLEPPELEPVTTNSPPVKPESDKQEETEATQTGVFHRNSVVYKGSYKDGKRHGYGVLVRPCGSRFEGEFRDDAANGHGTFYHPSGDVYEGQWQNNKAHGKGRFTHADGSSYEGQWVMDVQEGYGVEQWTDGSSYEGHYLGGKKCGEGRFKWPNGSIFHGQFKDNEINGEGVYQWKDGKIYSGQWVRNHMQGQGRMVLPDGRIHEGMYFEDRKHGKGRLTWPDGHYFEGEWDAGKQGAGRYFDPQGREMDAANEVIPNGTNVVSGKTASASSKSSLSVHVSFSVDTSAPPVSPITAATGTPTKGADKNKQQRPAGKEKVLAGAELQQMQLTATARPLDSGSAGSSSRKQKHGADNSRLERYDIGENAEEKKARRKKAQCTPTLHSTQQKRSTSQHHLVEEGGSNSAVPARDRNAATSVRRGDRQERVGEMNGRPPQQREQECERHSRKTVKEEYRQEGTETRTKNARSVDTTSHPARGDYRKRAFEGLFGRRK